MRTTNPSTTADVRQPGSAGGQRPVHGTARPDGVPVRAAGAGGDDHAQQRRPPRLDQRAARCRRRHRARRRHDGHRAPADTTAPAAPTVVTYPVIDPATGKPVAPTVAATASATASAAGSEATATAQRRSTVTQSASGWASGSAGAAGQQQTATSKAKRSTTTSDQPHDVTAKQRTATTIKPRWFAPTTTRPKRATTTTKPKPKVVPPPAPSLVYTPAQSEAIIRQIWPDDLEDQAVIASARATWFPPPQQLLLRPVPDLLGGQSAVLVHAWRHQPPPLRSVRPTPAWPTRCICAAVGARGPTDRRATGNAVSVAAVVT